MHTAGLQMEQSPQQLNSPWFHEEAILSGPIWCLKYKNILLQFPKGGHPFLSWCCWYLKRNKVLNNIYKLCPQSGVDCETIRVVGGRWIGRTVDFCESTMMLFLGIF